MLRRSATLVGIVFVLVTQQTFLYAQPVEGAPLPGWLAYIGTDYNVNTISLADGNHTQLTDDAFVDQTAAGYYQWPTWSNDGRLAYFLTSIERGESGSVRAAQLDVFISRDGLVAGNHAYTGINEVFQYAYWAPQDCDAVERCRDLAVLISGQREGTRGLFIELIRDSEADILSQSVGITTPPFYFSWSPDGRHMLWQRMTARLEIFDVPAQDIDETLAQAPGLFQAPAWSPVDDRLLFGIPGTSGRLTDLVILANQESQTVAADLAGPVAFAWSPDGNSVAYLDQSGVLYAIDAVSGQALARSVTSGVLAFFWSPDSERIAYVTFSSPSGDSAGANSGSVHSASMFQGAPEIAWSVLNVMNQDTQRYGGFRPTTEMIYLLTYFDQFAQSHQVWSPDSNYLVYSQLTARDQPVISVLDTSQADSVPFAIADGWIGVWSFS